MKIAVLSMMKDEHYLSQKWIKYHSSLFGAKNIYIIDNGSTDPKAKEVLLEAELDGVNVDRRFTTTRDFEKKGEIISNAINEMMALYDFFLPLDADEFFTLTDPDLFCLDVEKYTNVFKLLQEQPFQYFRINIAYGNVPGTTLVQKGSAKKLIIKSGKPISIDSGFHLYDWKNMRDSAPEGTLGVCDFVHVHFHWRHYIETLAAAREKLRGRVRNFRKSTLEAHRGAGTHLIQYFLMSPEDYGRASSSLTKFDAKLAFDKIGAGDFPYSEASSLDTLKAADLRSISNIEFISSNSTQDQLFLTELKEALKISESYFEYGLGGTTLLALEEDVQKVTCIETRIEHIEECTNRLNLQPYINSRRLLLSHAAIGDTLDWGQPRWKPSVKRVMSYIESHTGCEFDLILIDGRYRIACCASIYFRAIQPEIFFSSFFSKEKYGVLKDIFDVHEVGESGARLYKRPGCDKKALEILNSAIFDFD